MLVSLNAIKQYVDINIPTDELIKLIGSRLVEVEGYTDLAPKYDNIYIVKVVECEPIEGTHLHLCQIDAGEAARTVQVVCGAPNVHKGMLTAWIAPGAIVPSTYGNENFKISSRKLRGYESNGMLAAADELDLGTDHEGIIEIDPHDAKPGDKLADIFDLNDIVLDIENKSLTHRPDCFGLIGFAREVAGILGQPFTEPDLFGDLRSEGGEPQSSFEGHFSLLRKRSEESRKDGRDERPEKEPLRLAIHIQDATLCPRYSCAVLDFEPTKSKYFTRDAAFLAKAGMRSVDPIVDLTNILMLQTGQPLHAFDYDKFVAVGNSKTPKIIVRAAKDGEDLQLLDGKTISCTPNDILITSNDIPVALAGAMGGANTAIDASTKRIILESATFSLYNLRKTQMAHGIFSEAITRFTKGQPAALTMPVLSEAIRRLNTTPLAVADEYPAPAKPIVVKMTTSRINSLLGTNYDADLIVSTLSNVGFGIEMSATKRDGIQFASSEESAELRRSPLGTRTASARDTRDGGLSRRGSEEEQIVLTTPQWRTDIHIPEDIIEEVGRLLGYDSIPIDFPKRPFIGIAPDPMLTFKTTLRHTLSDQLRAHEALTYSFVSRDLLTKVGQDPADSYEIVNSISPELQCFRQHIAPSLIDKIRDNIKAGHDNFTLYEINQISAKSLGLTPEKTPITVNHLGLVTTGDYYALKLIYENLCNNLKLDLKIQKFTATKDYPYLEPAHAVNIYMGDQLIGAYGELRTSVLRRFKLDGVISALELCLDAGERPLFEGSADVRGASAPLARNDGPSGRGPEKSGVRQASSALSKFPPVHRDLTFRVTTKTPFADTMNLIEGSLRGQDLIYQVTPTSIYQPAPNSDTKNLSFHIKFASPDHTLQSDEISAIIEQITKVITKTLGAEVV